MIYKAMRNPTRHSALQCFVFAQSQDFPQHIFTHRCSRVGEGKEWRGICFLAFPARNDRPSLVFLTFRFNRRLHLFSVLQRRPRHRRRRQGQKQERTQKPPPGGHPVSIPSPPPRPPPGHGSHLRGSTQPWTAGCTVGHSLEFSPITWAEEGSREDSNGPGGPKEKTRGKRWENSTA